MEGGFSDPSIVRNAILTLMNQGSGHHDANTFLVGFESADETWQVLLHVLQEALQGLVQQEQQQQHEQVAFFASNLLYSKIFKYWKSVRCSKLGSCSLFLQRNLL
jgi:predicted nucleic acid-binding protein